LHDTDLRQSVNSHGTESGTVSDEIDPGRDLVAEVIEAVKRLGPAEREWLRRLLDS